MRSGGSSKMNLERYVEALSEPSSGLTYPALTGTRKQSVIGAERLFNPDLAAFMWQKRYDYEAGYIQSVWNWRRACDEHGLSELQCTKFNYQFLNMILDELMPWHKELYDLFTWSQPVYLGVHLSVYVFMEALDLEHLVTDRYSEDPGSNPGLDLNVFFHHQNTLQ